MTKLEALHALEELFSDPARHTRLYKARDADGVPCSPTSPNAKCWCFSGACDHITAHDDRLSEDIFMALHQASWAAYSAGIIFVSDHLGLPAVRRVITDAITSEQAPCRLSTKPSGSPSPSPPCRRWRGWPRRYSPTFAN